MNRTGTRVLINGKTTEATEFAYDGCHKIYLISTPKQRAEMVGYGYEDQIHPIEELPEIWDETCPLRFINTADLETVVDQGKNAKITIRGKR